jgi:predicted RND superfamily exporter protein
MPNAGVPLPKGATDAEIRMLIGLVLFLMSLVIFVLYRRWRVQAIFPR